MLASDGYMTQPLYKPWAAVEVLPQTFTSWVQPLFIFRRPPFPPSVYFYFFNFIYYLLYYQKLYRSHAVGNENVGSAVHMVGPGCCYWDSDNAVEAVRHAPTWRQFVQTRS